jgi:hypothetical protein
MPRLSRIAIVLSLAGFSVTTARAARRCDCVNSGPPCQAAWRVDEIFLARVVSLRLSQSDSFLSNIVRVQVTETFRGTAKGELEVWTGAGGGDCGFPFITSETYLIYARREPGRLTTSICSRTRTVGNAAEDLAYLRGPMREPVGLGRIVGRAEQDGDVNPWNRTPFAGARVIAESGGRAYEARSAADGAYELRVPAGKYALRVEVPDRALVASIQPAVEIADPKVCAPADVAIHWNSLVSGRVVGGGGEPLPGFAVELVPERELSTGTSYVKYAIRTTDRGLFRFGMMPPGRYYLAYDRRRASAPKPGPLFTNADGTLFTFELARGGQVPLADLALPAAIRVIRVSGVANGADGKPAAGAIIRVDEADAAPGEVALPVIADPTGRFAVTLVAGRRYSIVAESYAGGRLSSSEPLRIDGAADRPDVALRLRADR